MLQSAHEFVYQAGYEMNGSISLLLLLFED